MISFESAGARAFIQTNFDGSLVTDDDDIIVVWNPACEKTFGWTKEEAIGQRLSELIVPPELKDLHLAGIRRATATAKLSPEEPIKSNLIGRRIEIDALRKNGNRFPIELSVGMFHENGAIYYVARIRDITDLREAERIHKVMVHELNHRVRNSLSVVQSIVTNTLTSEKVAQSSISKIVERIGALGKAHSILSMENWNSGSLWSVVKTALDAHEGRINLHGPDVMLGPTTVITTALVLHELATNATKYGALSVPEGRINLTWFIADNIVHIFWVESLGPTVYKPTRTGFGTKMIQRLVSAESGASLDFFFEPSGLKVELELPFFDAN